MKRFGVILGFVVAMSAGAAHAAPASRAATSIAVNFTLQVSGRAPGDSYWVAYGPLGGHFGLVRLHRSADGLFHGSKRLPAAARATFTYLAGRGTVRTEMGQAPGNPVVIIRTVGPVQLVPGETRLPVVQWTAPVG